MNPVQVGVGGKDGQDRPGYRAQSVHPREPTIEKKRMAPLIFYCTHRSVILSGSIEKKPAETVT